jgi:hypothetical protein
VKISKENLKGADLRDKKNQGEKSVAYLFDIQQRKLKTRIGEVVFAFPILKAGWFI